MKIRNVLTAGLLATGLVAAGALGVTQAQASIPTPAAGNITVLPSSPRVVAYPGTAFNADQTIAFKVAGETFSGIAIPASATGVVLSVTSHLPVAAGKITVWTTEAGKPGTGSVSFAAGQAATNLVFVGLNSEGKFNVSPSVKTNVVMSIMSYVTPLAAPAAPQMKSIAKVDRAPIAVGGSIRERSTILGTVTLGAGTWDARVVASYTGFNTANNTVAPGVQLTGSVVLVDDSDAGTPADPFDFSDVRATVGGVIIPDTQLSATLTQDPTATISQIITLAEPTTLHVRAFAYASDSSTAGSGELKAGLDAATFVKIS